MSDPYREATRNETGGRFRVSKAGLLVGGALAVSLVALVTWMAVTESSSLDGPPDSAGELSFKLASARAAAAAAVLRAPAPRTGLRVGVSHGLADARQLAEGTAGVLGSILEDDGFAFTPVDEEPGFSLEVQLQTEDDSEYGRLTLRAVTDRIERVARGGGRLSNMGSRWQRWVPVYPGAQMYVRGGPAIGSLEHALFVVEAGAEEIVDWYQAVADFIELDATHPSSPAERRVTTVRMGPDGEVRERFAMEWGDRMVSVVVTEDEFGYSLVLLMSRG